jgi:adenosylmethionine-8-amino-7-oxononanoate aminotransferase
MNRVQWPDGNVLLRNLSRSFPVVTHGEGPWLFDRDGGRWLDGSSGAYVASVGHGNRAIADAVADQLRQVAYVNGTHFTSEATETLAARLCAMYPGPRSRAFFLSSGSEAIEAAIKFARQLHVDRGEPERTRVVARLPSYHGNTLYALSASGRPHYRRVYGPLLSEVLTVSAPNPGRSPVADWERDGAEHYARELEALIAQVGGQTIAAFLAEPVIGSSAGAAVPPPGYFERVSDICRRNGILLIADEVLCGAGRTGTFFASEQFGLEPDILVMGKGISGGYAPLSCVLVREEHVEAMRVASGGFLHAQTWMQAPCMTAAGVAVLDYYEAHNVLANVRARGEYLLRRLREGLVSHPHIGAVQGIGLLAGVELVRDAATREPFERAERATERALAEAFDRGLVLWSNVGHVDGVRGDLLLVAPPLIVTDAHVDTLVELLVASIHTTLGSPA